MKFRLATGFSRTVLFSTGIAALLQVSASRAGAQQAAPGVQSPSRVYAAAAGLFTTQPGTSLDDTSGATPLEGSGLTFTGISGRAGASASRPSSAGALS